MRKTIATAIGLLAGGALFVWSPVLAYPQGGEFQVDTHVDDPATTADNDQELAAVAVDAAGDFVVVYQRAMPGTHLEVAARLYGAGGEPRGPSFRVNNTGGNDTLWPSVAMDASGHFVAAWSDNDADDSSDGVMVRLFLPDGEPVGRNFRVNQTSEGAQNRSDVAMTPSGGFVVVWQDARFADFKRRVRGRVFAADGEPLSDELAISDDLAIDHSWPRVDVDAQGNFAVVWERGLVGRNTDLALRRFDALGNPLGPVSLVNGDTRVSHASGIHHQSDIARDAAGNMVVIWRADNHTGPGLAGVALGILGQRFDAAGEALGERFEVDAESAPALNKPVVAMAAGGDFTVAYEAPDASLIGIRAQRFHADGGRRGRAVPLNTFTTLLQSRPAIAVDALGHAVVVWQSSKQDAAGDGVFGRRLLGTRATADMDFNGDYRGDIAWRHQGNGNNGIMLMDGFRQLAASFVERVPDLDWQVGGAGDFNADGRCDLLWHNRRTGDSGLMLLDGTQLLDVELISRRLDARWRVAGVGDFDRSGGADILWRDQRSGDLRLWLMAGSRVLSARRIARPGALWEIAAVEDFDGDGFADILGRHRNGDNAVLLMRGLTIRAAQLIDAVRDRGWVIAGAGDVDRDGRADILWRHAATARTALFLMDGARVAGVHLIAARLDAAWGIRGLRDFDGDGRADILWRNTEDGSNRLWLMAGTEVLDDRAITSVPDLRWSMAGR